MMANEKRMIDADEKQIIIQSLKMHHDSQFTPGVYEHSVFGKAASCSICHNPDPGRGTSNYCSNCGARMNNA